jgi:hypothetical protein
MTISTPKYERHKQDVSSVRRWHWKSTSNRWRLVVTACVQVPQAGFILFGESRVIATVTSVTYVLWPRTRVRIWYVYPKRLSYGLQLVLWISLARIVSASRTCRIEVASDQAAINLRSDVLGWWSFWSIPQMVQAKKKRVQYIQPVCAICGQGSSSH